MDDPAWKKDCMKSIKLRDVDRVKERPSSNLADPSNAKVKIKFCFSEDQVIPCTESQDTKLVLLKLQVLNYLLAINPNFII